MISEFRANFQFTDDDGRLTDEARRFLRGWFERIGGANGLSVEDLQLLTSLDTAPAVDIGSITQDFHLAGGESSSAEFAVLARRLQALEHSAALERQQDARIAELTKTVDWLHNMIMSMPDVVAEVNRIRSYGDDLQITYSMMAPTPTDWEHPGKIGAQTANTGAFTTISASGLATFNLGANVNGVVAIDNSANTTLSTVTGRNTSAGNAAVCRASLGNNALAEALTIDAFGSNHATKPRDVEIINRGAGNLVLGTNAAAGLTFNSSNQGTFSQKVTLNVAADFSGELAGNNTANTTMSLFNGRNTSAGNAAVTRASLGNNNTAVLLSLDVFGNSHASLPNYCQIFSQVAGVMRLGTNNTWGLQIDAAQAVSVVNDFTASAKFGCNGKTAQAAAVSGGTLAGVIAALVANGILSS